METSVDFLPYVAVLVRRWKLLLVHFLCIATVAVLYAQFIAKKEYKAEITFLPPSSDGSLSSMMSHSMSLAALAGGGGGEDQTDLVTTIFASTAIKKQIIEKFNFYKKYKLEGKPNHLVNAIKRLDKSLSISADEKGGMTFQKTVSFTLTNYHTSPDTAVQIANFTFGLLDSALRAISTNKAHLNRVFIEGQLGKNKRILDSITVLMQKYQMDNKAYNVPEQARMSIEAYAAVKSSMQMNEIKMQAIKSEFNSETPELAILRKQNEAYQSKLDQLETLSSPNAVPSLQSAVKMLPAYMNMLRDIEVQQEIILLLTKEFEQSKLSEERDVISLCIIDPAFVPDYKARPKRASTIVMMVGMYMMFLLAYLIVARAVNVQLKDSAFAKRFAQLVQSKE